MTEGKTSSGKHDKDKDKGTEEEEEAPCSNMDSGGKGVRGPPQGMRITDEVLSYRCRSRR